MKKSQSKSQEEKDNRSEKWPIKSKKAVKKVVKKKKK